jgi:hypothetical protein
VLGVNIHNPPLSTSLGDWYMDDPFQVIYPLPPVPASGIYRMSGVIPPTPTPPYTVYLQALLGYQLSNLFVVNVQ